MKINTIICNYNYERYLSDAINSCINQTIKNKIIFIDDCSTDKSVEKAINILEPSSKRDEIINGVNVIIYEGEKGIIISLRENHGPSFARNVGFQYDEHADFYQILDADDYMLPNKIERMLAEFDEHTGVVYADYNILNMTSNLILREYKKSFSIYDLLHECIIHSGSLITGKSLRAISNNLKVWREDMLTCEDYNVWLRIIQKGFKVRHIPEVLTVVRDHMNNSTNTRSQAIWNENWQKIQHEIVKTKQLLGLI